MAPPTAVFPASELPDRIQLNAEGKRRKPAKSGGATSGKIDLSACELLEMMQWSCTVEGEGPNRPVTCRPVPRYFRRCQDAKGTFMVETTSWDGTRSSTSETTPVDKSSTPSTEKDENKSGMMRWTSSDKAPW